MKDMTHKELEEKLIGIAESCKLAGFTSKGMTFDGRDGGYSNQKEGYYDTKDAVKDLMKLITKYGDQRELEGRIAEAMIAERMLGSFHDYPKMKQAAMKRIDDIEKGLYISTVEVAGLKAEEVKGDQLY